MMTDTINIIIDAITTIIVRIVRKIDTIWNLRWGTCSYWTKESKKDITYIKPISIFHWYVTKVYDVNVSNILLSVYYDIILNA